MTNITLIGTVHIDHKGHERLAKALDHHRPDIICLEETPLGATKGWKTHLEMMEKLKNTPWHRIYSQEQIERVKIELLSSFYEPWVPKNYKNIKSDTKLYCIDDNVEILNPLMGSTQSDWLMQQLRAGKTIKQLITPADISIADFVKNGSVEEHQAYVDSIYDGNHEAELIQKYGREIFDLIVVKRDQLFASKIRTVHEKNPDKKIVTIVGAGHLFSGYGSNTYDLLADLNPMRVKLKEFDGM